MPTWAQPAMAPAREPSPAPAPRHPRWRARAALEAERRQVVQSAAAAEGLPPVCVASGEQPIQWRRPATAGSTTSASSSSRPSTSGPRDRLRRAIEVLEATPAFGSAPPGSLARIGTSSSGPVRTVTENFVCALFLAASRNVEAQRGPAKIADSDDEENDLDEAVSRRLANSSVSRYEYAAETDWPKLAARCPRIRAKLHLSPSGLVNYTVGPREDETDAAAWSLSGEGWWRVLPVGGQPTEVLLEMLQGLTGCGPPEPPEASGEDIESRRPFTLRVELRRCVRIVDKDADEEEEDDVEDEDEDEDSEESGTLPPFSLRPPQARR